MQIDSVDVEMDLHQAVDSVGILYPGQRMDFVLRCPVQAHEYSRASSSSMTVSLDRG